MVAPARAYVPNVAATRVVVDAKRGRTYLVFVPADAVPHVAIDAVRGQARIVVPAGVYSPVPAWYSRESFLTAVEAAVRGPWAHLLRRTEKDATTADTFMRWLRRETSTVDLATGRGQRESVAVIARDLGCSEALVRRCRRIARDMGIYRDIVGGRLLRLTERLEVHEHGSTQRGVTGERAFTLPRELLPHHPTRIRRHQRRHPHPVSSATHPLGGASRKKSLVGKSSPKLRNGENQKVGRSAARSWTRTELAAGAELAKGIAQRVPYGHRLAPKRLARALAGFAAHQWTPKAVIAACDAMMTTRGWHNPPSPRSPGGYLVWMLESLDATAYEPEPTPPPWCGHCDHTNTRRIELDDGRLTRCPTCNPQADRGARERK